MADRLADSPRSVKLSLSDLLGAEYTRSVGKAHAFLSGTSPAQAAALAQEQVELYPAAFARRIDELLPLVGTKVTDALPSSARGAGTRGFQAASKTAPAPVSGLGLFRVGEDGRLYLASKAEHYHLSVGHGFPGYRLLELARQLGIPNCTHNNTRGHVTRLLEEELVAAANGLGGPAAAGAPLHSADRVPVRKLLESTDPRVINRVINLETGSLAVEAALKIVLRRFYRFEKEAERPPHEGRIPVLLVIGDYEGGIAANYHGTTSLTQVMRGLWPALGGKLESSGAFLVRPVKINDIADFTAVMNRWDTGQHKVAAFFHEIVLMNYGAVRMEPEFLRRAYEVCREHEVPIVADEIQSCIWSPQFFLFREYGLQPDVCSVGKGFPGGEYPAARILCTSALDSLPQFGALVTNGQEEIASLAFLVTMAFARANHDYIQQTGEEYERRLRELAARYPAVVEKMEGRRHLASLFFRDTAKLSAFVKSLNEDGIDISIQSYKAKCPPSCLTKLPLVVTPRTVEFLVGRMDSVLAAL
ncbi:MAG TPA: aminotransferase class III-fold pyridoxal phosphate-dependent enzyme [Spirochaetia bacterium]|nr:aminotransferase class III-fold pyridoxal phosphate-dependent enzyme [Spirochaetia bacterium]